jgi:hypothetical protein
MQLAHARCALFSYLRLVIYSNPKPCKKYNLTRQATSTQHGSGKRNIKHSALNAQMVVRTAHGINDGANSVHVGCHVSLVVTLRTAARRNPKPICRKHNLRLLTLRHSLVYDFEAIEM